METITAYRLKPTFGNSFRTGWKVMIDNFLRLFLVVIVLAIIVSILITFWANVNHFNFNDIRWNWHENGMAFISKTSFGILSAFLSFLTLLYGLMVVPVFTYGGKMIFVESVRKTKPNFEWLIKGFTKNYFTIVLAHLLVFALVAIGLFAFIVPGIIIACRLVFVKFIVMDKQVDPIEAVEMSWKLTRGHGWKIFLMGLVSYFILLGGTILAGIGILPAIMWISSSFATLYQSVLQEKEKPAEAVAA